MSRKPTLQTTVTTTTTKRHELTIDADQLRAALANCGIDVPAGACIQFHVPRGGDWSGTAIDIDREHAIHVEWTETETSEQ